MWARELRTGYQSHLYGDGESSKQSWRMQVGRNGEGGNGGLNCCSSALPVRPGLARHLSGWSSLCSQVFGWLYKTRRHEALGPQGRSEGSSQEHTDSSRVRNQPSREELKPSHHRYTSTDLDSVSSLGPSPDSRHTDSENRRMLGKQLPCLMC